MNWNRRANERAAAASLVLARRVFLLSVLTAVLSVMALLVAVLALVLHPSP